MSNAFAEICPHKYQFIAYFAMCILFLQPCPPSQCCDFARVIEESQDIHGFVNENPCISQNNLVRFEGKYPDQS